ncbi:MAG: hypothetical protein LBU27_02890 [Candidatus Peribacteria bacterium]|jgi:hypothetical protein|nr:hypothetical protein [Candidatus Peribacteria bacterium]
METVKQELLELLQAQKSRKAERNYLWFAYLSTKGKKATSYLKHWTEANDELHRITMQIADLSLILAHND